MRPGPRPRLSFGLALGLFAAVGLVPLAAALLQLTPADLAAEWGLALTWRCFGLGLLLALLATLLAGLAGGLYAFLVARTDLPLAGFFRLGIIVPLLLPPTVLVLGWLDLAGISDSFLAENTGFGSDLRAWFFSFPAAALLLALLGLPLVVLLGALSFAAVDPELEELARLDASRPTVLRRVTLPLAAPGLALAGFLVFVLSLGGPEVPDLLGLRQAAYGWRIFDACRLTGSTGRGVAAALPLLLFGLAGLLLGARLWGERAVAPLSGSLRPAATIRLGRRGRRLAAFYCGGILFLASGVPLLGLVVRLLRGKESLAQSFAGAWGHAGSGKALLNSFGLAALAATLSVVLALVFLFWLERRAGRLGRALLLAALALPFIAPAVIYGAGMVEAAAWTGWLWRLENRTLLVVGVFVGRFLVAALKAAWPAVKALDPVLEEAARVDGASGWLIFTRVVWPLVFRGALAGWLVAFALAQGEIFASHRVEPPAHPTLALTFFSQVHTGLVQELSALCLIQLALVLVPLGLGAWVLRERGA